MFDHFRFSLPRAVTEQLVERLDQMQPTPFNLDAIKQLSDFQEKERVTQGVYVIYILDKAVYAGKARDLAERLEQHFEKLRGRKGIKLNEVGIKGLLLDENWSTSANEDLIIKHFKDRGQCQFNGSGFGPKDPGKNRDGSEPSRFDMEFPINEAYPIDGVQEKLTIGEALAQLKAQLPYLFRYSVSASESAMTVDLTGVPRTAQEIAVQIAKTLGESWQLMRFKNGFTLYKGSQSYAHGEKIMP